MNADASHPVLLKLESHPEQVRYAALSPDGNLIVTSAGGVVRLWDATSGEKLQEFASSGGVDHPAFSPDSRTVAAVVDAGTVRLWDVETGHEVLEIDAVETLGLDQVTTPDDLYGTQGLSTCDLLEEAMSDVFILDRENGVQTIVVRPGRVEAVAFSPDGQTIATAQGNIAQLWDVDTGQEIRRFAGETMSIGYDEAGEGVEIREAEIAKGHAWPIRSIAFSPNGKALITGNSFTIRLWDVASGEHLRCNQRGARSLSFSPDGGKVVATECWIQCGPSGSVYVWDALTGRIEPEIKLSILASFDGFNFSSLRRLPDHFFRHATFSPDGQFILSASTDKTARVWNAETGELAQLMTHPEVVNSAEFAKNGAKIVTALGSSVSEDADSQSTAWVWNARHPKLTLAAEAEELADQGIRLAQEGNIDRALREFESAQALNPFPESDLAARGRIQAAIELYAQSSESAQNGEIDRALAAHTKAAAMDPGTETIPLVYWTNLCYYGSVGGRAHKVLEYCDMAVALASAGQDPYSLSRAYDIRGVARALAGDLNGALEDLEYSMRLLDADETLQKRQSWIGQLQDGKNPFSEATLDRRWRSTLDPSWFDCFLGGC
jgi:WD40 repeat protein